MQMKKGVVICLLILFVFFMFMVLFSFTRNIHLRNSEVIVTGEGNPGNVAVYSKEGGSFVKRSIPTGYRYVWTVRVGDAAGLGHNVIYAGVGNSFFGTPHGCRVISLDPARNYQITTIDDVGDLRCKDLTIGDPTNSGHNSLILGTHGKGIVRQYIWDKGKKTWKKTTIDENSIQAYDQAHGTNHRLPEENLPYQMTDQTDVHIVRVGDADNDGKNELLAAESNPLENPNKDNVLLLTMYKYDGKVWKKSIIDTLFSKIPFKATIRTVDLYNTGKNEVLVSASHHQLLLYTWQKNAWQKRVIDQEAGGMEDNMKGVAIVQLPGKKYKTIFLGVGLPHAAVYQYDPSGSGFTKRKIADISSLLSSYHLFKGIGENILDTKEISLDGKIALVAAGEQDSSFYADKLGVTKFGWEGTTLGFTALLSPEKNGSYQASFLDYRSVLALDTGRIE